MADVAEKVARQLAEDTRKARTLSQEDKPLPSMRQ
jgi:hypothetical protein